MTKAELTEALRIEFTALKKENKKYFRYLPKGLIDVLKEGRGILTDNPPTIKEIIKYLDTKIESIRATLNTINDLSVLKDFEDYEYGDLEAYYESYSKYLEESDRNYYRKRVEDCKRIIDNKRKKLSSNTGGDTAFINEIEIDIIALNGKIANATTLEDGEALRDELRDIRKKFESYTKDPTAWNAGWLQNINGQLDSLQQDISEKNVELSEDVADGTNTCKVVTLNWVVKKHKRNVEKKEAKIDKSIIKISETLKQKYTFGKDEEASDNQAKRKKRLVKKLKKLKIKEAVQNADNTKVSDTEPMDIIVTFCKKQRVPTGSDKGPVTYWGIQEVKIPNNRQTSNDGGLSYTFSSNITSNGFSDVAVVNVDFVRQEASQITFNWDNLFGAIADAIPTDGSALNWPEKIADLFRAASNLVEEANVPSKNATMLWTLSIDTDPQKLSEVNISITPDDFKNLGELEYKRVETFGTQISFESNLKEANAKFLTEAKAKLK